MKIVFKNSYSVSGKKKVFFNIFFYIVYVAGCENDMCDLYTFAYATDDVTGFHRKESWHVTSLMSKARLCTGFHDKRTFENKNLYFSCIFQINKKKLYI